MEKRTNSPYPRIDRLIMAGIGVVLVAGTVLFIWSDRAHDWRYYQMEFRQMVAEKFGDDKAVRLPSGVMVFLVGETGLHSGAKESRRGRGAGPAG